MRDVELYQQLLGLVAPWTVGRVELSVEGERVDIWAEHAEVRWPCPECETLLPVRFRLRCSLGGNCRRRIRRSDRLCVPAHLRSRRGERQCSLIAARVGRSEF